MLRKFAAAGLAAAIAFSLAACGLKGDLYMPESNPSIQTEAQQ